MNDQEYLNQISSSVRPVKAPKQSGIMSSPIFKVALIGIVCFVVIAVLGAIVSGTRPNLESQVTALVLHLDNTSSVISNYQGDVKSSSLRSSLASLNAVFSTTSKEVTSYLSDNYGYRSGAASASLIAEADAEKDELESDLFNAKISGTLDRIFAHKMAYEITMVHSEEQAIYRVTSDAALSHALESSMNSLSNLYDNFNNFSETK